MVQESRSRLDLRRRSFLQGATAGGLGVTLGFGAVQPTAAQSSESTGDASVLQYLYAAPTAVREDEFTPAIGGLVTAATGGKEARVAGHRPLAAGVGAPIAGERYVESDGRVYRLDVAEEGTASVERFVVSAESAPSPAGDAVAIDEFPAGDRPFVRETVRAREASSRRDLTEDDLTRVVTNVSPAGDGVLPGPGDETGLLPKPTRPFVRHDGDVYRLSVRTRTVELPAYTYTASPVADDWDAFVTDRSAPDVALGALPDAESDILERAVGDGFYRETRPLSDEYSSLLGRLGGTKGAREFFEELTVEFGGRRFEVGLETFHSCVG